MRSKDMFELKILIKDAVEDAIRNIINGDNLDTSYFKAYNDGYTAGKRCAMKLHLNSMFGAQAVYADTDSHFIMNTPPRFTPEECEVMTLACRLLSEMSDTECGQISCAICKMGVVKGGKAKCVNNLLNDIRRKYS